jgi:hypothetical protein
MDSPTENPSARTEDLKRKPTNLFAPKLKSRADSTGPRLDASTKENERDTKTSSKSRAREQQKKTQGKNCTGHLRLSRNHDQGEHTAAQTEE